MTMYHNISYHYAITVNIIVVFGKCYAINNNFEMIICNSCGCFSNIYVTMSTEVSYWQHFIHVVNNNKKALLKKLILVKTHIPPVPLTFPYLPYNGAC